MSLTKSKVQKQVEVALARVDAVVVEQGLNAKQAATLRQVTMREMNAALAAIIANIGK